MSKKLTRAVAQGIQMMDVVKVEHNGEVYDIEIRPLRHTESTLVQQTLADYIQMEAKSIGKKKTMTSEELRIDYRKMVGGQYKAWLQAAAMGTTDPEWTEETIDADWKSEWIQQVGEKVMEISGIESLRKKKEKLETDQEEEELSTESFR